MDYRLHTSRLFRAGFARLLSIALCIVAFSGCQNNAANDLVARDRRMQEDQIYMLQDYVKQYQGLVCRYRSENATLRQQLAEGYPAESPLDELRTTPGHRENSVIKSSPQFTAPQTPSGAKRSTEPAPPTTTPSTAPAPPPAETPEVPPLRTSAQNDSTVPADGAILAVASTSAADPQVVQASYEEPTIGSAPGDESAETAQTSADQAAQPAANAASSAAETDASDKQTSSERPAASELLISGEVVANDAGGGPRLMIDVSPQMPSDSVDAAGGSVSLMLVTPGPNGGRQTLGRWDFGPNEVRSAIVDPNTSPPVMRFYIELPAEVPIGPATQVWARLLPRRGLKLLAHANVDLTAAGSFSSQPGAVAASTTLATESVSPASFTEESPTTPPSEISPVMNEGKWVTAEPGKPANLPAEAQDTTGGGGWRVSSEPMPAAVANITNNSPEDRMAKLRDEVRAARVVEARAEAKTKMHDNTPPATRPAWSSDRPSSAVPVAQRPSWSATR